MTGSDPSPKTLVESNTAKEVIRETIVHEVVEAHVEDAKKVGKKTSYFNVIFSGFALFSDGYQSGIISSVNLLLSTIYGSEIFSSTMSSRLSYALFVGAIIGQIGFGLIIDRIGRKIGLILTTALVILGAALTAASSGSSPNGLLWMMVVCRGILGVGVGGEYPCSSVSAGEAADDVAPGRRGGLFILVTNFVIDSGYVASAVVTVVLLAIFKDNLEPVWRLALGLGIIPPLSVLYFRLKMADSKRYQQSAIRKKVPYWLIVKKYWRRMLLTAGIWFIYNFIGFPMGVFSSIIIKTAAPDGSLLVVTAWNVLLYAFYLPGSFAGAFAVDRIGRRKTLAIGLFLQAIIGFIIGGTYYPLSSNCFPMFVIMYGLFMAVGEFGPGDCMGLNAMELYPTAVRGTGYGISAAIGKVGATVGTYAFAPMQEAMGGVRGPFLIGSAFTFVAGLAAFFFLPEAGPDYLAQQDAEFKEYLEANGYDVSQIGLGAKQTHDSSRENSIEENSDFKRAN